MHGERDICMEEGGGMRGGGRKGECGPSFFCDHHFILCLYFAPLAGGTLAREGSKSSTPLPHARVEQHG